MHREILPFLRCPACESGALELASFSESDPHRVRDGVVWCTKCKGWYPVEDELLEFLTGDLVYFEDREKFAEKYSSQLSGLGLASEKPIRQDRSEKPQHIQQAHFDWYADNADQSYSDYEKTPFWLGADRLAFDNWRKEIREGSWLLDIGCAQGRSTFKFMDLPINILGMDISKKLIRQAIRRYREGGFSAKATFIAGDASRLPVANACLDFVLIYGVLHHLPDPGRTCKEVGRILKNGGVYFGSENNVTVFRKLFDLLQKIFPIWSEVAGPEALISKKFLTESFCDTGVRLTTRTSVFLPPHVVNFFSLNAAHRMLRRTDALLGKIPFLKSNGGLIIVRGEKSLNQ
jgi:ubiquinone/menaquinone biosynthesis C-methylase UbiE/uncharacterized protein YbaR (Trm112 family)